MLIHGFPELFGLYQWWSDTYRYTGIGQVSRPSCPRQGGLSKRFLEHLFASLRLSSSEGGTFRYRLARRTWLSSCFFLVIAAGPELQIRAMEAFDIRAHRPSSNCAPKSFYGLPSQKDCGHQECCEIPIVGLTLPGPSLYMTTTVLGFNRQAYCTVVKRYLNLSHELFFQGCIQVVATKNDGCIWAVRSYQYLCT